MKITVIMVVSSDVDEFLLLPGEEYMSRSLSTLRMSGHLLLREELMSLINFPGPFQRQFSLLAEKHRKK